MNELAEVISGAIMEKKQTGSDYTAKVTRVEGSTAYVQITGSDIADTPVAMSVSCKPGDMVRVRVADGKAWITGNDTAPPTDDTEVKKAVMDLSNYIVKRLSGSGSYSKIEQTVDQILLEVGKKMDSDMGNRKSSISIDSGKIEFNSNSLVVNSSKFSLDDSGNATFGGTLNAAGGSFRGKVSFDFTGTYGNDLVYIGDPDKNSPIYIQDKNDSRWYTYIRSGGIWMHGNSNSPDEDYIDISWYEINMNDGVNIGTYTASGYYSGSDRRLKDDITDLSANLAKQLHPIKFRFKGREEIHYGFIAQEVRDVLPDAVHEAGNGTLLLNYQEIIAPLTALVQEQEDRINQLEARLKALEDKQ